MNKKIKLLPLSEEHLPMVLTWRNDPDVRKNMYTSHEISLQEHEAWFKKISSDETKRYFIFELDNKPCGVIGFVDIDLLSRTASWAFYSGDTNVRGIGSLMEITALDYAFNELSLHKLNCEVLEFNAPVIKFHKKHGFRSEGVFRKQHFADKQYWDIYRLAIFDKDWQRCRDEIVSRTRGRCSPGKSYRYQFSITKEDVQSFAEASGDFNSVHFNDETAQSMGFDKRIVHGFLVSSVFTKVFGTEFPGEGTIYLNQSLQFEKPVYRDDKLEAVFQVISKIGNRVIISTCIINIETQLMVISGQAELLIPEHLHNETES
ncbi:MAG: UDP-4-amino-4,6-dideoxy-N-acetyl-beta-L-altrosamine N-acetyltransferase [Enterobacterales bacterium]|nr:UDP-4-amino-4,6-dideoxy-N-acetyl-beta-L-altrosamine N-acetyltransferase [Enterobacterales bacterium]